MTRLSDAVLEHLDDGRPHSLREVAEEKRLTLKELQKVVDFLTKYGFVAKKGGYLQIDSEFRALLKEL